MIMYWGRAGRGLFSERPVWLEVKTARQTSADTMTRTVHGLFKGDNSTVSFC